MRATTPIPTATKFAVTQTDLQDTQLTSLSDLAASLKKAVSDAVANNDATTLMTQAQSIFDQATRHPEFQGRQWRLYLWRRQDRRRAGDGELAVGAGRRCRRSPAPSPMAT